MWYNAAMARLSLILFSCALSGFAAEAVAAGDPVNGRQLAVARKCTGCHGMDGNARSTSFRVTPMLAGQPASYLVKEMRNYASGKRIDESEDEQMAKAAAELSPGEMEDIAAFYEAQSRY
ncbi:c-type cytochrome [Aliiruegeria haliotis]|nr:c-type cytochrome [Aliiruegeria haliotis]